MLVDFTTAYLQVECLSWLSIFGYLYTFTAVTASCQSIIGYKNRDFKISNNNRTLVLSDYIKNTGRVFEDSDSICSPLKHGCGSSIASTLQVDANDFLDKCFRGDM